VACAAPTQHPRQPWSPDLVQHGSGAQYCAHRIVDGVLLDGVLLDDVRPELVSSAAQDEGTLFLTCLGERISDDHLSVLVGDYVRAAFPDRRGSCHLFRHSMATLMLQNGADIHYVQQLLGHADIKTTQIYTQVAIRELREIHARTHPVRRSDPLSARRNGLSASQVPTPGCVVPCR